MIDRSVPAELRTYSVIGRRLMHTFLKTGCILFFQHIMYQRTYSVMDMNQMHTCRSMHTCSITLRPTCTCGILCYAYALRSTDAGNTFSPMINLDGPWHGQTSMFPKGEPMQGLELSPFETAEGDIFVLDRPASSPWMWESWALPRSKGSAFGPATRGPFPLYACCECSGQTLSRPVLPLISARAADRRRHDHDGERRAAHLREVSAPLPGQALC